MRGFLYIILLTVFLLLGYGYAYGQRLNFKHLTVQDGLPQNTVSGINKDKYGFMWFGTWNGLCRYDGYKFKVYTSIPGDTTSLTNNRIHYIYKDKDGTLWISTFSSGVCRYNYITDNFTRFHLSQLPKAFRDSVSRLQNLSPFKNLSTVFKQGVGDFKISSTGAHIVFEEPDNGRNGLNDNNVYCAYKDNNLLWIGTATGGVNKADLMAAPFHIYSFAVRNNTSLNVPVRAVFADSLGIWAGTQDKGLYFIDHNNEADRRFIKGTLTGDLRSIFKDSYGQLWLGYRTGLDKFDIKTNIIVHCFEGKDENKSPFHFLSITEDPIDRSVWFGTAKSILRYDQQTKNFEKQSLPHYEDNSSATCLFFDSHKSLWIGTEYNGLLQFKRDVKTHRWTGSTNYNVNGEKGKRLLDNRVYTITQDEFGNIWAGSASGLCKISPYNGIVKIYTKTDGLSDEYIAELMPDNNGNIWISHKKGLSKLTIKTGMIANYSISDAFNTYEFMDGSGCADKSTGKLYFGGTNGFVSFYPKEINSNPYPPTVVLTELRVLNTPLETGQKINDRVVLTAPIYLTPKLKLTYLDRSFSIEFAALQYSNPEKNQYAYMLEGVDKDWIHTDASNRIANYSNLTAGRYVFKVKASNSDGLWSSTLVTLEITVLPPWWKTWWANLIYFFLFMLSVLIVLRVFMIRQKYNKQILIERLKTEKAQELEEAKTRFFTNVSHEFRTPLTLIIGPLKDLLQSATFPKEKLFDYYGIMLRNAQRLLGLINQFLDMRKLETGHLQLRPTKKDVVAYIKHVLSSFYFQAEQKKIEFQFHSPIKKLEFIFDADVLDKILFNLISNAFKFTDANGKINLSLLSATSEMITLSVSDNGLGISAEMTDKIFEPFYQVESSAAYNTTGTGIGLSLIRELILLHKGTIEVSSRPYVETRFTVSLKSLELNNFKVTDTSTDVGIFDKVSEVVAPLAETEDSMDIVLIVEDNLEIRQYLQLSLMANYKVVEAVNGLEGFEKAVQIIPDIIISDIMMPEMDGIELCRKLKADERTSHIPLILLTARQSEKYQMEGLESGVDDYVGKPFSTPLLLVRIKNLLTSRKKLRQLFDKSSGFNPRVIGVNAADKAFISKMTDLIEANMSDAMFNVEWLGVQLNLSRTQLYRKIKALTDQTVHEYITTIRLNKAAALLLEGSLTVAEIAFNVGYSEPSNFSRSFQKQFGQTPKKFSQQGKNIPSQEDTDQ